MVRGHSECEQNFLSSLTFVFSFIRLLGFECSKDDDVFVGFSFIKWHNQILPSVLQFSEAENFPCWEGETNLYFYPHKEFSLSFSWMTKDVFIRASQIGDAVEIARENHRKALSVALKPPRVAVAEPSVKS